MVSKRYDTKRNESELRHDLYVCWSHYSSPKAQIGWNQEDFT